MKNYSLSILGKTSFFLCLLVLVVGCSDDARKSNAILSEQSLPWVESSSNLTPASVAINTFDSAPNGTILSPVGAGVDLYRGQSLTFEAMATDPDGDTNLSYSWSFGAYMPAVAAQTATVKFDTVGVIAVQLNVRDSTGKLDPTPDTIVINILNETDPNPVPTPIPDPNPGPNPAPTPEPNPNPNPNPEPNPNPDPNPGIVGTQELPITVAVDKNLSNDIVEVDLIAMESKVEFSPGVFSNVYTYNGVIPGPLIKTKVGDTLIVNFTNNLPEPTTIHWHGLRLPADMDGSTVAQNPIQPGESFVYQFQVHDAALFWYHPHVRSNAQVEKGLAGTLLVENPDSAIPAAEVSQEIMIFDDILLDPTGQVTEAFSGTPEEILLEKINGREGNVFLVNGKVAPSIPVEIGKTQRWRIVNIANTRFLRLSIPNVEFTRVGGDEGLLYTPEPNLKSIFLVPGQRADVVFTPTGVAGDSVPVIWTDTSRGRHSISIVNGEVIMGHDHFDGVQPEREILTLNLIDPPALATAFTPPWVMEPVTVIDTTNAKTASFTFSHGMPMPNGMVDFYINGKTFAEMTVDDALDVQNGDIFIWDLVNMSGGDHPFHLHGFFFQVIETIETDVDGAVLRKYAPNQVENLDTVNLPRRPGVMGTKTTVRIAIDFSPGLGRTVEDTVAFGGVSAITNGDILSGVRGQSGGWQFHCHILEHADTGMMSFFELR